MQLNKDTTEYLNNSDNYIVCCFFTDNYQPHAESLKISLAQFNLSYYFKRVDDAGYWEGNTRIKPHFIQECLQRFPDKAILYLDADAVVKGPLDYFNEVSADAMLFPTEGLEGMSHAYLAGTIFLNNNDHTKQLVQQWIEEQNGGKRTQVDQDSLDVAMQKCEDKLTFEALPAGYIKIFDKDYDGEIYIEQYQASRSLTKLRRQHIRWRNRLIGGLLLMVIIGLALYFGTN